MRFSEPRPARKAPAKARDLIKQDLNAKVANVVRDFSLHVDTFHLLFPDQRLVFTPTQILKVRQILANTKQGMKELKTAENYSRFVEELAAILPELPEARKIYSSAGMRALLWKPDETRCFVEDRDIEPWIQFLESDPRMKQSKIGNVGGITLSKSILVLSLLRPELKTRLRPLVERLVKNGMARHGFALGHDVMRVMLDLRVVFPDLPLPDEPFKKGKKAWIQGWERQVRQDHPDTELLNNYSGTAIFLTGDNFYLDEMGRVRYTLNHPMNLGKALPMREAI